MWNKTYAVKFNSKMLTDEIIDQIKIKGGFRRSSSASRTKQLTTRQKLNYYNIQEIETIDLSLELYGGTEATESTVQRTTHNDAPNTERKPLERRC